MSAAEAVAITIAVADATGIIATLIVGAAVTRPRPVTAPDPQPTAPPRWPGPTALQDTAALDPRELVEVGRHRAAEVDVDPTPPRAHIATGLLGLDADADTTPVRQPIGDWARTGGAA